MGIHTWLWMRKWLRTWAYWIAYRWHFSLRKSVYYSHDFYLLLAIKKVVYCSVTWSLLALAKPPLLVCVCYFGLFLFLLILTKTLKESVLGLIILFNIIWFGIIIVLLLRIFGKNPLKWISNSLKGRMMRFSLVHPKRCMAKRLWGKYKFGVLQCSFIDEQFQHLLTCWLNYA